MEPLLTRVETEVTHFECREPLISGNTIKLRYAAKSGAESVVKFTETIEIPGSLDHVPETVLAPVLRLLSLAVSLSYFKAFAPISFDVPSGLTQIEREFIEQLIANGMGEFAFVNDLPEVLTPEVRAPHRDADSSGVSEATRAEATRAAATLHREPRSALVAVGGGKDSIVSIEALKTSNLELGLFSVNRATPIVATASVAGLQLYSAKRHIDPELFRLNSEGATNGHIPVTAINSLVAELTALALDFDSVVFSNEAGSSFGNFSWHGREINHQWSKGFEFERLLRRALPPGAPQYFSLLRPLSEMRIARRFATHVQYHGVFTSCNRAYRLSATKGATWCADCPKCRFIFLTLAPYLSKAQLLDIFAGRDMFADERQFHGFLELLGVDDLVKPFECVGEPAECRVAVSLLHEHAEWKSHTFLRRREIAGLETTESDLEHVFTWRGGQHFLPQNVEVVAREI